VPLSLTHTHTPFPPGPSSLEEVENITLADNLLELSQREREASAERRRQESQELARYFRQERPHRDATPPLLGGREAYDEGSAGIGAEEEQVGVADRIQAEVSHSHNVPSIGGKCRL